MNRLQEKYKTTVVENLTKKFGYTSVMQVPYVDKIVINIGCGDAIANPKSLEDAVAELAQITGQKPVITKAKKSIANFKLREGAPIGCKVTLRKEKMYDFITYSTLPSGKKPMFDDSKGGVLKYDYDNDNIKR